MSSLWVFLAYGSAILGALLVLYFFHARSWYWHTLSVTLALVIGLAPLPAEWRGPEYDVMVGSVFLFLLVWGVSAPVFRHRTPRAHY